MKILIITSFIPQEQASQAGVRITYNLIKTLEKYFNAQIDVCGLLNLDEFCNTKNIKQKNNSYYFIPISKMRKIRNILKNLDLPILAAVRYDDRLKKRIIELLNKNRYDYIICDYTQNSNYINDIKKSGFFGKTILIEQDVSFLAYVRKYKNTNNLLKKYLYLREYKRLKEYELNIIKKFDYVITLNNKDAKLLDSNNVKVIIPYISKYEFKKEKHETFNIMFWGAMNRKENEDAVIYFLEQIWPKVNTERCKFYIIGANPSKKIKDLASNDIIVTGYVDNPVKYFKIMDLSVVPLRLGAGIKIKVLESLASKIPVVTTSIGAEGIDLINEKHAFITDNPDKFATYINILKNDKKLYEEIRNNGYKYIEEYYNEQENTNILKQIFNHTYFF